MFTNLSKRLNSESVKKINSFNNSVKAGTPLQRNKKGEIIRTPVKTKFITIGGIEIF